MPARAILALLVFGAMASREVGIAAAQDGGVPPDAGVAADAGTESGSEPEPEPEPESESESESESGTGTGTGTGSDSDSDSEPGSEPETGPGEAPGPVAHIRYFLDHVEVRGNQRTKSHVVRRYVPFERGAVLDVDDPAIEAIRYRLLGTGFFEDVRLSLDRADRRGWVVLVVEVEERNTIVVEQLQLGLSRGVTGTTDPSSDFLPYIGATVSETNLLGLGMSLSLSGLVSELQQGVRLRFTDPIFLGSDFSLSVMGFYNDGREFFGRNPLVAVRCPPGPPEDCPPEVEARRAVVYYRRGGLSIGSGHDLGPSTWLTLDWQGELVDVPIRPDAASETRGADIDPIDFAIREGTSIVSLFRLGLHHDTRNDPALPSSGFLVRILADAGGGVTGSDYNFFRLQALAQHWISLPWGTGHSLRLGLYGGAIFGDAPFFYKLYAADLSDLIPSRILEMNIDDREPPNMLYTVIREMRAEDLAARLDLEYALPLFRGDGALRAVAAYANVGLYMLVDHHYFDGGIAGYEGAARIPVDLTFDFGVRFDTNAGLFQLGFSTLVGFIDL